MMALRIYSVISLAPLRDISDVAECQANSESPRLLPPRFRKLSFG